MKELSIGSHSFCLLHHENDHLHAHMNIILSMYLTWHNVLRVLHYIVNTSGYILEQIVQVNSSSSSI